MGPKSSKSDTKQSCHSERSEGSAFPSKGRDHSDTPPHSVAPSLSRPLRQDGKGIVCLTRLGENLNTKKTCHSEEPRDEESALQNKHPPKRRGELAELAFMRKAISLGFGVAKPWGDSDRYDFILDSGRRLWRVQVRSTEYHTHRGYAVHTYVEALCGRERSGRPQPKSRAQSRDLSRSPPATWTSSSPTSSRSICGMSCPSNSRIAKISGSIPTEAKRAAASNASAKPGVC